MREQRNSDRLDLSLDGRQVAGVVTGALVALAAVFALGVGFGRQLATAPIPLATPAGLDVLDAPAQARTPTADTSYTFHEQLVKSDAPAAPAPAAKPAAAAVAAVAAVAPPAAVPAAELPTIVSIDANGTPTRIEPSVAVAAVAPAPALAEPAAALPVMIAAKAAPAQAEAPVPTPRAEPPAPAPAPAPRAPAAPKPGATQDKWTVQFGASPQRADADRLAASLLDFGYTPYVAVADIPGKGRYYRVRVGQFASKDAAEKLRRDASAKHRLNGVVMPAR